MTLHRRIISLLGFSLIVSSPQSMAADAYFSKDGGTVTLATTVPAGGLVKIDIASGAVAKAPLPPELNDMWIGSVAQGAEGETLFLANNAVWVWNQGQTPAVRRVCFTDPVLGATDLFVATKAGTPLTDCLFISGIRSEDDTSMASFYARKPGEKAFAPVFCRRVDGAESGVFTKSGRLFFQSAGDLWEGGIQPDEETDLERFGTLVGARIAPLALLNTDEGNSGGLFVYQIAPAGKWIYLLLNGRHESAILRMPLPAKTLYSPTTPELPKISTQLQAMSGLLDKSRVIVDSIGDIYGFCATEVAGNPRVFYCTRDSEEGKGPAIMLWDGAGQPRIIGHLPTN